MAIWRPDPSFYPSPKMAMQGPREKLAYVAILNPDAALTLDGDGRPDALAVFDVDPDSETQGQVVGRVEMPNSGDELHHFGWNACSSALCPYAPHPHSLRLLSEQRGVGDGEIVLLGDLAHLRLVVLP